VLACTFGNFPILGPQSARVKSGENGGGWEIVWGLQTNDLITFSSRLISFGQERQPNGTGQRTMTEIATGNGGGVWRMEEKRVRKLNINYKKLKWPALTGVHRRKNEGETFIDAVNTIGSPHSNQFPIPPNQFIWCRLSEDNP